MLSGLELFADEVNGQLMAAVMHKGVMIDFYTDAKVSKANWASLYLGKVTKIDTKLDAAIVDLGNGVSGLLAAKHVRLPGGVESERRTGIGDMLKSGQMILVQVKAEGKNKTQHENHKMPRLTMKLYIPGLFVAYSPTSNQVTISRKIENENVVALTSRLEGKGGWVVQHSAEKATRDEIELEAETLRAYWQKLVADAESRGNMPGLLMLGPNALYRPLVDYGANQFEHIHIGCRSVFDLMGTWCARHLPPLATSKRLKLFKPEKPNQKLFDIYDVFGCIDDLHEATIHFDNGGSMVIEHTAALTIIDVNQGSASSILDVNISAAKELARHCRMRNLSGAILIDFISMEQKSERLKLIETLEYVFDNDKGNAQVHGFTRLGIIEMTRKRRTASLREKLDPPAAPSN